MKAWTGRPPRNIALDAVNRRRERRPRRPVLGVLAWGFYIAAIWTLVTFFFS